MTHEKWSALAMILIVVAMIVGGCTRSHEHKTAAEPSVSTTPTAKPTATATTPPTGTTKPPGVPTCQAAQLKVKLAEDPGGGAAGSTYSHLTFANTGATTCVMTGWPGVSYVGSGDGTQIGSPADRTGSPTVVSLKPGAAAEAPLKESAAGNFDADCIITPADGLRVYSPNSKVAVFVAHTVEACAAPSKHLMTIGPVRLK